MDLIKIRKQLEAGKTVFDLPLRVVYYARVSTDREEQLNSLENQTAYYSDFIGANKNWVLSGAYIDEGISGTKTAKRDDFNRMIADAKKGLFDLIIVKSVSRFARNTLDSIAHTRQLKEHGVGVFFQADNIFTLDSDGELRLTIMASLAQEDSRRLSENVKFGMKQAYKDGKVLGNENIYGYTKVKGKLIIDEKQADFIRDLFKLYAEDKYGFRTLARMLHDKGYRNQSGEALHPGIFKNILRNPKYKGYYRGRCWESADFISQKKIKLPEEDQLLYEAEEVPAIVSEALWDKANEILEQRTEKFKKKGRGAISSYSYSGKIFCGTCELPHYHKVWRDRPIPVESWCCKTYLAKGRKACQTPHLNTKPLEAILEYIGNDILDNKEQYIESMEHLLDLYRCSATTNSDTAVEMARVSKDIARQKKKQDKLLDLYTDGDIEKADYLEKNTRIKDDIARLLLRLDTLKAEQDLAAGAETSLEKIREFFDELINSKASSLEIAREMLESVTVLSGSTREDIRLRVKMRYGKDFPVAVIKPFTLYAATEVAPVVGSEKQSEDLIKFLVSEFENNPSRIWETNIFGKSLYEMVTEQMQSKLTNVPEHIRVKLQRSLQKISDEGKEYLICVVL